MKKIVGSPGTASGMSLRVGQCGFAAASIGVMAFSRGFSSNTAFCYLIASMGLQLLWSFGLACLDIYALRRKRNLDSPVLLCLFVVGDWVNTLMAFLMFGLHRLSLCIGLIPSYLGVTATLSLAAACSSAGVIILYARDLHICPTHLHRPCTMFQIAVAFSFLTWGLIAISSYVMFWILASI